MISKVKIKLYNLLRKSEKYTKTDMVYLAKGGFWLTLGYGVNITKGLVISILMANLLDKEVYGYYRYILSIFSVIGIFGLGGLSTAITQSVARNKDGIVKKAIQTVFKWSWIGSIILLGIATYYLTKNNLTFTWVFIILAILFPAHSISGYYGAILSGKKKFDTQTKYYTIYSLISAISIIMTVIISKNVFWIILAIILSDVIVGNFFTFKTKKFLKNKDIDNDSINYGIKLSAISIIGIIAQNIDKIILPMILGYQELAIYAIALIIPEQIKNLFKNIGTLALPKFSTKTVNDNLKNKVINYSLKTIIIIIPIIIIYWLTAEWIFELIYPKYLDAVIYSKIFSISLLTIPSILFSSLFQANKKAKIILKDSIVNSIIQIVTTILFTIYWGLLGLIISRIITRFINYIYKLILIKKINQ